MRLLLLAFALVALCWSSPSRAQTAIEHAIQAGDWPAAARQAEAALASGGVTPERWVQLQLSLGLSRAHLGESEPAQRAFLAALALDPAIRLGAEEPVEVRSPFMEARGFWSQHSERLGASAELSSDGTALRISLVDPAALVGRVVVHTRTLGQGAFQERSLAPSSALTVALDASARTQGAEYSVVLIDENANRLYELGSDAQPRRVKGVEVESAANAAPVAAAVRPERSARPYHVGAAVSLVVAAGAAVVAGVSHAEREQLAKKWNSGDCEGEGSTRGEVCADEHDQLERYQRLAIGFYAVAGAGLVAGIATLIAAPRKERAARAPHAVRCGSGPGLVGLACAGRF